MSNGLIFLRRIFCCKLPVFYRFRQMWWKSAAQNASTRLNALSRVCHQEDVIIVASRKIILLILVLLGLFYYFGPSIFNVNSVTPSLNHDVIDSCLQQNLHNFQEASRRFEAFITSYPSKEGEKQYPAYVGNGHLAAAFKSSNGLFVRLNRALSVPVKFYPIVSTSVQNTATITKDVTVLQIRSGIAYKIQAVKVDSGWRGSCISVSSQLYAHRSRPSVLVQDIRIKNPSKNPATIELDQAGSSGWNGAQSTLKSATDSQGRKVDYTITFGEVQTQDTGYVTYVTVATVKIPEKYVTVPSQKTKEFHFVTVVHYSPPMSSKGSDSKKIIQELQEKVDKDMVEVLKIPSNVLREEHMRVWNSLWQSGFGISYSKASGALNGDKINTTLYYVLSNIPAPLHNMLTTAKQKSDITSVLHYPDRCYGGHSTLHANTLWVDVADEDDIARVTTTWMITLEKQGCTFMVKAGAEGVLQAIMLSLGGLKFSNDHLELAMEPKDLHRDLFFHRINYGNNTHLNISVIVGQDNKANLYVALDRNDRPYYACDAGCIDAPMALSKETKQFPVKQTKPLTSILYITADKLHMEELKHAIHVKEIIEAPAHEHHVLALHRHGHHFGGLPTLFWVSIAFLVIIFHLFLCKLIYNEYCQGQERFIRGRYNV